MSGETGAGIEFEHRVLGEVEIRDGAGLVPVLGDTGDARADGGMGRPAAGRVAFHLKCTRCGADQPADQVRKRSLAVAGDPGQPGDLACAQLKMDILQPRGAAHVGRADTLKRHQRGTGISAAHHGGGDLGADHHLCHGGAVSLGRLGFGHQLAVAQDDDAGGDCHDLVQFVGNEDDRQAKRHGLAHGSKEVLGLLRGQNGGGLVQNQDARLAVEGFKDLNPLAFADAEAADLCIGIDPQSVVFHQRDNPLPRLRPAKAGAPDRTGAEDDVFQHGHIVREREMLVYHADAGGQRRARIAGRQTLAKDFDMTFVRRVMAKQDVHQRGLARAVFA